MKTPFLLFIFFLCNFSFASLADNLSVDPNTYEFIKKEASSSTDKDILFEMGRMYYFGVKNKRDGKVLMKVNRKESLKNFKKSYDLGNKKETAPFIGNILFYGNKGVKRDTKGSLKYLKEALESGNPIHKEDTLKMIGENKKAIQNASPDFFKNTKGLLKDLSQYSPKGGALSDFNKRLNPNLGGSSRNSNPGRLNPPIDGGGLNPPGQKPAPAPKYPQYPPFDPFDPNDPLGTKPAPKYPQYPFDQISPGRGFSPLPFKITQEQFNGFREAINPLLQLQIEEAEELSQRLSSDPNYSALKKETDKWIRNAKAIQEKPATLFSEPLSKIDYNAKRMEDLVQMKKAPSLKQRRAVIVRIKGSQGNGVIYNSKYIITNYHVVNADLILKKKPARINDRATITLTKVGLSGNEERKARVVYYDCDNDLALLEIEGAPLKVQDVLDQKYIDAILKMAGDANSFMSLQDLKSLISSPLHQITPLESDEIKKVQKGDIVEYMKKDLSVIEKGKVVHLNNDYGILEKTNIVPGYSGGGIYLQDELGCITHGGFDNSSPANNDRELICISSHQVHVFMDDFMALKNQPTKLKEFCECTSFILVSVAIFKRLDNPSLNPPPSLEFVVSAKGFLHQISQKTRDAISLLKPNHFANLENRINKEIAAKKSGGLKNLPAPDICKYF